MSVLAAGSAAATRLAFLADDTDVGDETHKGGPLAILVIVVLGVACFFLFRSMSRHLRTVRDRFPEGEPATGAVDGAVDVRAGTVAAGDTAAAPAPPRAAPGSTRPVPKSRAGADDPR